jgi:hypothetical protein
MKKRSSYLPKWINYLSTLYKVTWSRISTSNSFLSHRWNGWFQMNRWITLSVPNLVVIQRFIWNHSFHRWVLSFFVNTINYCSIGTQTLSYCINKEIVSFSKDTFLSACRMALFDSTQRSSASCWHVKNIAKMVLSRYMWIDTDMHRSPT